MSDCSLLQSGLQLQHIFMDLHANIGESLPPCGGRFILFPIWWGNQNVCRIKLNNNHLWNAKSLFNMAWISSDNLKTVTTSHACQRLSDIIGPLMVEESYLFVLLQVRETSVSCCHGQNQVLHHVVWLKKYLKAFIRRHAHIEYTQMYAQIHTVHTLIQSDTF